MARRRGKELYILKGQIKTPPMSALARQETGWLLRRLQEGETLGMPQSRPMPEIGRNCHELRINDENETWRVIDWVSADGIAVLDVFSKKTRQTPKQIIDRCARRLRDFQNCLKEDDE